MAENECAADTEALSGRVAGGDATLGDEITRGDREMLHEMDQRVGDTTSDGKARGGVRAGDELAAGVDDGVVPGHEGGVECA